MAGASDLLSVGSSGAVSSFANGNGRHARIMADEYLRERFDHPPVDRAAGYDLILGNERRDTCIVTLRKADRHDHDPLLRFAGQSTDDDARNTLCGVTDCLTSYAFVLAFLLMMVPRVLVCSPLRRIAWKRRGFALLAAPFLIATTGGITPVAMPVEPDDARAAMATAHLVQSILEYTRWPQQPDPIRVCVVGRSRFGSDYPFPTLGNGVAIVQRNVTQANASAMAACDVLYLGDVALKRARQWTAAVRGAAVVTIAERDPQCIGESMFCLVYRQQTVSFRINTDAIARSNVRIDPRVLRISRGG